jgi:hypothetical protein
MALPWLIGALVVGAASAIAAAVSGDDSSSSSGSSGSGNNEAEERRRRETAEQKRRTEERDQRRADARAEFSQRGAAIGRNLASAMEEWVQVDGMGNDAFLARLTSSGYRLQAARRMARPVGTLLELSPDLDGKLDQTMLNLDFFGATYDVQLHGARGLHAALGELNGLNAQAQELASLKQRIGKLERGMAARNAYIIGTNS